MGIDVAEVLKAGLSNDPSLDRGAGIEIRQNLEPAGGLPVQPPSYEGRLEIHDRHIDGEVRSAIELDSVGSCANRIEEVLLDLHRAGTYPLPVSDTTVAVPGGEAITITTLEAPHRIFDAWLRLSASEDGNGTFESSDRGRELVEAHLGALDAVVEMSAHDLLLGAWDSHRKGPNGQLRIARALTSSLIGFDPKEQAQFAARRDPLNLGDASDPPKGANKLSGQGLSSIPPQKFVDYRGGVSISSARYMGYLSFPALRRLGFASYDDVAVRSVLASLALYAVALRCAQGWDLRSRCTLLAMGPPTFTLITADGTREALDLSLSESQSLFEGAAKDAAINDRSVHLNAGDDLEKLVAASVTSEA